MRSSARPLSEDIAIASLWGVLMRSWLRVLIVAGLAGAMVFGALTLVPPRFAATALLSIPQPAAGDASDNDAAERHTAAAMIETLRSRGFARKLAPELERAPDGELVPNDLLGIVVRSGGFARPRPGETAEDLALAAYYRSLRVTHDRGANAVAIEFTSTTPQLSARAANRLAELYLADEDASSTTPPSAAEQARAAQIERLAKEVAAADAAVERMRGQPDAASREQRLKDLAEALAQAQRERGDAETRARAVRAMLDKGSVEAIPEVQPSPALHELIAERVRVEIQKAGAERTLPPGHPRVRELQAKLSELRWRMFREATSLADALDIEVRVAAQREAEGRARLDAAKAAAETNIGGASDDFAGLTELEREAAAKRQALETLQAQEQSARAHADANAAPQQAAILSPAQPSADPVFPRKGPLALLTAVSTLMMGFIFVITRQLINGARRPHTGNEFADLVATARDRADVRLESRQPDAPDAPATEALASETAAPAEPGHFTVVSSTDDAVRHIAGRSGGRTGYRTLLAGDGIDGAGEARDLVSALAAFGRRGVLVDWCPEGSGIATALGLPTQPGINDLLAGRATFDDVIMRLPDSDAHFIACGTPAAARARALDADWISLILDALDEAYDHIVVVSRLEPARALFEAIEGRFDAGIVMAERRDPGMSINAAPGVFLGFEVTEICILQLDLAQRRAASPRRLKRTKRHVMA